MRKRITIVALVAALAAAAQASAFLATTAVAVGFAAPAASAASQFRRVYRNDRAGGALEVSAPTPLLVTIFMHMFRYANTGGDGSLLHDLPARSASASRVVFCGKYDATGGLARASLGGVGNPGLTRPALVRECEQQRLAIVLVLAFGAESSTEGEP